MKISVIDDVTFSTVRKLKIPLFYRVFFESTSTYRPTGLTRKGANHVD